MTFEEIFSTNKDKVLSICFRYLQQQQEAEDAVQDIFVKVYQKQGSFREDAQITTWIYRISVNHCLDVLRSRKRKKRLLPIISFFPFLEDHKPITENKLELKEAELTLYTQLLRLPEKQLTALVLNRLEGFQIDKVAQIMNLSYKAVESLLQRGKQNLHKSINQSKE